MRIFVDNFIWFYKSEFPDSIVENCKKTFTYQNPEYFMLMNMGKFYTEAPRKIMSFIENDKIFALPRGTGKYLSTLCKASGLDVKVFDRRVTKGSIDVRLKNLIDIDGKMVSFDMRKDQKRSLSELIPKQQGCLEAPCGAGKTVLMLGAIAEIKQPTLILVHTLELLNQWKQQIEHKLEGDFTLGILGGGKNKIGDITIATVQTLYRYSPKELKELAKNFGCVIQDESHHAAAKSFTHVINYFPAKYRFGVTATPKRKDKLEFLMYDVLGKIVARITDEELLKIGKITSATVEQIATEFYSSLESDQWVNVISSMVLNEDRNKLIINKVVEDWNAGHFILVLSDRVDHCYELQKKLQAKGMNVKLLIGAISKEERQKTVKDALDQKLDVVVGTTVADEGLDIPLLSSLHMTTPANNNGKIKQRCGRIRRVGDKLAPVIRDYVDVRIGFLAGIGRKRARWYESWGFDVIECEEVESTI